MSTGVCLQEDGEKTVVLKSEGPDLHALEAKAQSLLLPTFLVEDAGKYPERAHTPLKRSCIFVVGT